MQTTTLVAVWLFKGINYSMSEPSILVLFQVEDIQRFCGSILTVCNIAKCVIDKLVLIK